MAPAQRSLPSARGRTGQFLALDDFGGAEPLEIVDLRRAAGRGDHVIAELGQQRDRDRADAAGRAGDDDRCRVPA